MRHKYLILPLLFPLCAFSIPSTQFDPTISSMPPVSENSIVKTYSNEFDEPKQIRPYGRSMDYPTQIIRMSNSLKDQQLNCEQVNETIEKTIVQKITSDKFTYNIYIVCSYDPETRLATEFLINSYFDPLDDKAIEFLKTYLAEYDGSDFLGTKLKFESAKALIISLNIIAGVKKNPNSPLFLEYRKDRSNFYFTSNYEMRSKLIADAFQNFFTNDPNKVLPFLNKWFFASAENLYKAVLTDSNYVELQPEKIFIMDSGNEMFVSKLKYYFIHNCSKYENQHCLATETSLQ